MASGRDLFKWAVLGLAWFAAMAPSAFSVPQFLSSSVPQSLSSSVTRRLGWHDFIYALAEVESSHEADPPDGDGGRAIGALQIHHDYWADARMTEGNYQDCRDPGYARRVVLAYLLRYAPRELAACDWRTCARVHNGGPGGATKPETLRYWRKVQKAMKGRPECGRRCLHDPLP